MVFLQRPSECCSKAGIWKISVTSQKHAMITFESGVLYIRDCYLMVISCPVLNFSSVLIQIGNIILGKLKVVLAVLLSVWRRGLECPIKRVVQQTKGMHCSRFCFVLFLSLKLIIIFRRLLPKVNLVFGESSYGHSKMITFN